MSYRSIVLTFSVFVVFGYVQKTVHTITIFVRTVCIPVGIAVAISIAIGIAICFSVDMAICAIHFRWAELTLVISLDMLIHIWVYLQARHNTQQLFVMSGNGFLGLAQVREPKMN